MDKSIEMENIITLDWILTKLNNAIRDYSKKDSPTTLILEVEFVGNTAYHIFLRDYWYSYSCYKKGHKWQDVLELRFFNHNDKEANLCFSNEKNGIFFFPFHDNYGQQVKNVNIFLTQRER